MKREKYKTINWSKYNKSLVNRGDITLWIDEEVSKNWINEEKSGERGSSILFTDIAIETCLKIKYVYKLTFRQTQGFMSSIIKLAKLNIVVPDYSTMSRRQKDLNIKMRGNNKSISHIVIDSTGLKVYGEGEWKVRKHGVGKRRTWRKLHLAVDSDTFDIVSMDLTTNDIGDSEVLEDLMNDIEVNIESASLDGAYDTKGNYNSLISRNIEPIIPPRENAIIWDKESEMHPRNRAVKRINESDRKTWKIEAGYHRRSLAEVAMFRFKTILGGNLSSRSFEAQKQEAIIKSNIINKINTLGMPQTIKVS